MFLARPRAQARGRVVALIAPRAFGLLRARPRRDSHFFLQGGSVGAARGAPRRGHVPWSSPGVGVRGWPGCAARAGLPASLSLLGISPIPHATFRAVGSAHPAGRHRIWSRKRDPGTVSLCGHSGKPREKGKEIFSAS